MYMLKKRLIGGGMACALAVNCLMTVPFGSTAAETKFEFENGTQTGSATVMSEQSGYSGTGYVFLQDNTDTVSVTVTAPETGMYDLSIGYAAIYGDKVQGLEVNGENQGNVSFPEGTGFEEIKFGTVKLNEGENTVTIVGSWGWTLFDYVSIATAELETLNKCNILSDPKATAEAQGLMNYMADMYGDYIVSGQQETYGGGHNGNYEWEFDYLYDLTGEYPAIRGFDFMNYNSLYGWDDGTTERVIDWVNEKGGIATASWHINVPKDMSTYNVGDKVDWSNATYGVTTDFSPTKILTDKTSKEYLYFMDAVDLLATELKQLQDAGVPLLFRPFHEAEGGGGESASWFWWGKDGSTTYKALWQLLYKTLTEEYGLHNLVWEFNSYTYGNSFNWYPGNDYVDIVGYDKYNASANNPNESAISSTFNSLVGMYNKYGKMIALSECDTIPALDNMTSENAYWLYFCPWYEGDQDNGKFLTLMNNPDTLTKLYQSETVITLDELPDYKTYEFKGSDFVPEETEPTEEIVPTEAPEEGHAKVVEEDGYTALIFPEAVGESFFVEVEFSGDVDYANGGIGAGSMIGDTYYWANINWEATAEGVVEVDTDDFYNVTTADGDVVTDEAIISQLAEILKTETTSFQAQVWYAGVGADKGDTADVKFVDAWLSDTVPDTTEPGDPTEPTDTPEDKDVVEGTVKETTDGYAITLPQAVGETLYLQVELATGIPYANGCVAGNVDVDGTTYWVAVQWEASGSGDIEMDMTKLFQVSLDGEEVTDEKIVAAAAAGLLEQKNLTAQVWWANDAAGEAADTSNATITGAYILGSSDVSSDVVYGDVNCDGQVSIADVLTLNKNLMCGEKLSDEGAANADVDGDGAPSSADALNILKFVVKILDKLPV